MCIQHPAAIDEDHVTEEVSDGHEGVCAKEWLGLICKAIDTGFPLWQMVRKQGKRKQGAGIYQGGVEMVELDCKVGRATQEDETVEEDDGMHEVISLVTPLGDNNDRNEEKNGIGAWWPWSAGR